jgi:hypothetical protein
LGLHLKAGATHIMTNVELLHQEAVKALNAGKLNEKQKQFVEGIRDFDKKQLKKLSSAQFKWLKDIAKLSMKNTETLNAGSGDGD